MSDSDELISQLEAFVLEPSEDDTSDLKPPIWQTHPHSKHDTPPAPSPFEDYQKYPFHWTGESLKEPPVELITTPPLTNIITKSALIAQFPSVQPSQFEEDVPAPKLPESPKPAARKRRFKHLRHAMSLNHIRHKPTPPDTAPPTPTVPNQVPPSLDIKSLESLTHWQLPDPTSAPVPLDDELIHWPSRLSPNSGSLGPTYRQPRDQLSPPSSIPSESDILPHESLVGLGIRRSQSPSPSVFGHPIPSTAVFYPPTLFDAINLSNPDILQKDTVGKVVAGTVEGLVAYITSPDCLDYEVLSDFFMMYRKFMEPSKLLGLLCARFEWGLMRGATIKPPDNEGMVRVRTFAALRHWLLNYFADDFAPSQSLRSQFIKAINSFGRDARVKGSVRDTRIVTELKRCWRRVCSIYWDGQARASAVGNVESEISLGLQKVETPGNEHSSKGRLPSLIIRATRKREEMLGVGTSRSSPDLRRRFVEHGRTGTVNSNRPTRGHARIHSTSSINTTPESISRHRRNLSGETRVIFSNNTSPGLFQSFARGDGRAEWPPVVVRADLLTTPPKDKSILPSWNRHRKRLFISRRKKLAVAGLASSSSPKSSLNLVCGGQLSDDEDSQRRGGHVPSLSVSEPARDRVDFLAAGMWASFISATSKGSYASEQAEELGEALVQGYQEPVNGDQSLVIAALIGDCRVEDQLSPVVADLTITSSESQGNQTTLSMSEIERRLAPPRPPSTLLFQSPNSLHTNMDIQIEHGRYNIIPTPPPAALPPPVPPRGPTLRRRPGGDLRHADTIEQLHPRRHSLGSVTSSMSDFSFAAIDRTSNLVIPSMSTESRSLRSLLGGPYGNVQGSSPAHRVSGLAMDFSQFRIPEDVESSDDENCDPAVAVQKTLMKLEGTYVRKKRRRSPSSDANSGEHEGDGSLYGLALSTDDLGNQSGAQLSVRSESPPPGIMVERDEEARWARRHKHVVDGKECDTPTRHGPFVTSSLFESIDPPSSPIHTSQLGSVEVQDPYIPVPTVESALAELERNQLESQHPRLPNTMPPERPDDYHRSLASHLPFILQYDSILLAQQFTLIEKDILAEVDWFELIEPTWIDRSPELVDVRDWKGFIIRDEGEGGLHTIVAHFNLMAGWTTSEVVLTQSLNERIMVISKFIRLAVACQRLNNFATVTQIVVGLQSQHVAALYKSWEGLKPEDKKSWHELLELVDASKNWSNMRRAMDRSGVGPRPKGVGCIPFIGVFMSDLVHVTTRSLPQDKIDFEGLRIRASIVKNTLRMIELADEYDFQPESGLGERCLWITAFDEKMLHRIARSLE